MQEQCLWIGTYLWREDIAVTLSQRGKIDGITCRWTQIIPSITQRVNGGYTSSLYIDAGLGLCKGQEWQIKNWRLINRPFSYYIWCKGTYTRHATFPRFSVWIYGSILWRHSPSVNVITQTQGKRSMSDLSPLASNIIGKTLIGLNSIYWNSIKTYILNKQIRFRIEQELTYRGDNFI